MSTGLVVTQNTEIPDGSLVFGILGKFKKEVPKTLRKAFQTGAEPYTELGKQHKKAIGE